MHRVAKVLFAGRTTVGSSKKTDAGGTHGCDGVTNGSMRLHDEMAKEILFTFKKGKVEGPPEETISQVKGECTERFNAKLTSSRKSKEQHERFGGTGWDSLMQVTAALFTRTFCSNLGALSVEVQEGPFNMSFGNTSCTAVLSRSVPIFKFKEARPNTTPVQPVPDTQDDAFDANLENRGSPDMQRIHCERQLQWLTEMGKMAVFHLPWLKTVMPFFIQTYFPLGLIAITLFAGLLHGAQAVAQVGELGKRTRGACLTCLQLQAYPVVIRCILWESNKHVSLSKLWVDHHISAGRAKLCSKPCCEAIFNIRCT